MQRPLGLRPHCKGHAAGTSAVGIGISDPACSQQPVPLRSTGDTRALGLDHHHRHRTQLALRTPCPSRVAGTRSQAAAQAAVRLWVLSRGQGSRCWTPDRAAVPDQQLPMPGCGVLSPAAGPGSSAESQVAAGSWHCRSRTTERRGGEAEAGGCCALTLLLGGSHAGARAEEARCHVCSCVALVRCSFRINLSLQIMWPVLVTPTPAGINVILQNNSSASGCFAV